MCTTIVTTTHHDAEMKRNAKNNNDNLMMSNIPKEMRGAILGAHQRIEVLFFETQELLTTIQDDHRSLARIVPAQGYGHNDIQRGDYPNLNPMSCSAYSGVSPQDYGHDDIQRDYHKFNPTISSAYSILSKGTGGLPSQISCRPTTRTRISGGIASSNYHNPLNKVVNTASNPSYHDVPNRN